MFQLNRRPLARVSKCINTVKERRTPGKFSVLTLIIQLGQRIKIAFPPTPPYIDSTVYI